MYKIIGADGKEYGPVATDVLMKWVGEGRVNGLTKVLPEGAPEWKDVAAIPELAAALAAPPPATLAAYQAALGTRTNPMALTGMILGLVSISVGLCCCYGLPFSVPGIIFSCIGLSQIKNNPQAYTGRGMAIAGLVLSILSILLAVGLFVLFFTLSFSDIMRDVNKL